MLTLDQGSNLAQVTAACHGISRLIDLSLETESGSNTPTPTATPTVTHTPTNTPTTVPDAGTLVDLRHETDLAEYDLLVGNGALGQSTAAALADTAGGLAVSIDDLSSRYGEVRFTPSDAPAYRYRFYLDPNGLEMIDWKNFVIARTRSGGTAR